MKVRRYTIGDVAIVEKRLSSRERSEPEAIARLRAEKALLETLGPTLGGRAVPRLVASGEDIEGPWFHTELLPFETLRERIDARDADAHDADDVRGGREDDPWALWLARSATAAVRSLAELHEAADEEGPLAIVHADLSPANIVLDDAGSSAVLLDLELACFRGSPPRDGSFRGTIAYAAPEIARGERPTTQSDLFALAASFLHAVTGVPPRQGPSLGVLVAIAAEVPITVPARALELGPLTALFAALAHEPAARPSSARALLGAMNAC